MEEPADVRRESAIASSKFLQPNFKPKSGVSEAQISRFQELHKKRLQLKAKSRNKGKVKEKDNGRGESRSRDVNAGEFSAEPATGNFSEKIQENFWWHKDSVDPALVSKKRQKLHWGLEAKERWERKSNM